MLTVQAEGVAVAADKADLLVRAHPAQAGPARREQLQAGVAGQLGGADVLEPAHVIQLVHLGCGDIEFRHARPAGLDGELSAVLLGVHPAGRGLDAHR